MTPERRKELQELLKKFYDFWYKQVQAGMAHRLDGSDTRAIAMFAEWVYENCEVKEKASGR